MALCGSTTACCVYASLRQTAGMCQPRDEWSPGYRRLWTSCVAGLTCTAGLTCLRAKLLHDALVTRGWPALTRKRAGRSDAVSPWPPARGAECDKRRAMSGCVILLELPLCRHLSYKRGFYHSLPHLVITMSIGPTPPPPPPWTDPASSSHLR